jgi:hypothetical protein
MQQRGREIKNELRMHYRMQMKDGMELRRSIEARRRVEHREFLQAMGRWRTKRIRNNFQRADIAADLFNELDRQTLDLFVETSSSPYQEALTILERVSARIADRTKRLRAIYQPVHLAPVPPVFPEPEQPVPSSSNGSN